MLTTRLSRAPPPDDDTHLMELLRSVCHGFSGGRGQSIDASPVRAPHLFRRIALLGEEGHPYRMIVAQGEPEFIVLLDVLSTLRFAPSALRDGLDAVLQRAS